MDDLNLENETLGSAPSIVQYFSIEGLYGYRSVSLTSDHAATILIAKNGAGKTTLLGALAAFLKGQFGRLSEIEFRCIVCRLRGLDEALVLSYGDVVQLVNVDHNSEFTSYAKRYGLDISAVVDYLDNEYPLMRSQYTSSHPIFEAIRTKVAGYSSVETKRILERLSSMLIGRSPNVDRIKSQIKSVTDGFEIVYLPTYRRVEAPLSVASGEGPRGARKKTSIRSLLGVSNRGLFDAEIEFGLSDISARLSDLNQEILVKSNQGYREISANIINELIENEFESVASDSAAMPEKEALNLFLSRLKDGRRMGPYGDVVIPNIDKIYNREQISYESNRFLTYFLSKLNKVIDTTRDIERMVEDFINSCNRYLSSQDLSTCTASERSVADVGFGADDKVLRLDRRTLKVNVESLAAKRRISLEALSSGEKQMISLFARLYLYPGKKIVLIDEPELSLSLDWQRKILIDVVKSPSCAQVVAITHSPFVFENELEPFAKSLKVSIVQSATPAAEMEESDIDEFNEGDELDA